MKTGALTLLFVWFLGGVAASFVFDIGIFAAAFASIIGLALFFYSRVVKVRAVFFVSLFFILFAVGVLRTDTLKLSEGDPYLDERIDTTLTVMGRIVDEPDAREEHTILTLEPVSIGEGEIKIIQPSKSRIRLYVDSYPEWNYGDKVKVSGTLKKPENFESETGYTFAYVSYLAKDGIFYEMFRPKTIFVETGAGNSIKSALFSFKHALTRNINKVLPEPESALAGGITLGTKTSLGEDALEMFRITGIVHIVVLSGYNITIVADSIMRVLSFFPRMAALFAGSAGVILFAIMTGAGATVVRASIMALLVVIARATGRIHEAGRILLVAAAGMVLWNPYILLFDPSFQLSFLATLGLIYLAPVIERMFVRIPERFALRSIASATVAAQIAVLPLLLYQSGIFSTVSLPVNMLVLPFVPLAMLASFLAAVAGFIGTVVALPFGFIAYLLLGYMFSVVEMFASLPFASFAVPAFPLWAVCISYCVLAAILVQIYRAKKFIPEQNH